MKKCSKCKVEKPSTNEYFQKNSRSKDGFRTDCKECRKKSTEKYRLDNSVQIKEQKKKYRENNKIKISEQQKIYYKSNKERLNQQHKKYRMNNEKEISEQRKIYRMNNRVKINNYVNGKMNTDINYKLSQILRNRILRALKNNYKYSSSINLLGCTIEELKQHLESQFQEGMTWENHGLYGWHIDHIMPCANFDLSDEKQQRECFHYTNLQPLWAKDNIIKSDKVI